MVWVRNVRQPHPLEAAAHQDPGLPLEVEAFLQVLMPFCANSKKHRDLPSWRKPRLKLLRTRHRYCRKFKTWRVREVPCLVVKLEIQWEWAPRKVLMEDRQEEWHCSICKMR
mmetsp:Transcript_21599/g.48914  ORF Transcript_21599/g.48914 Transcript_21599/m.48914 type:complete len:112 (-) Transcript_21599:755-1090(-)